MNEFMANILNMLSFDVITKLSWLDILSILTPSVILISILLSLSFFIKIRRWRYGALTACLLLMLTYLPYELLRQSKTLIRADANVSELHDNLQELLSSAQLDHMNEVANKEVASNILEELIKGIDENKKKDLVLMSWLIAENEKNAMNKIDDKQKILAGEIKSSLNETKAEIIDSRPPVEQISDTIVKRLDDDIDRLMEKKMDSFKQDINDSLDNFKESINAFIQSELGNYQEKLAEITQQNVDELRNYSNRANQAFADHVNKINQESIKRMDATQESIAGISTAVANINLKSVSQQVKQLSASIELAQKKNDILFEYNECLRSTGILDLTGKEEQCRNKMNESMSSLN